MAEVVRIRSQKVLIGGTWRSADVTISDGRITEVASMGSAQDPIDLGSLAITPGMIDVQCNGGYGFDFTIEPGTLWEVGKLLPATGVTSFLPTVVTSPPGTASRLIDVLNNRPPDYVGADPMGIHIEGPMLSPERPGAHDQTLLRQTVDIVEWSPPAVRIVTLAPEVAGLATVKRLAARGVVVSVGHSNASFEQSLAAFDAGASHATHLFNAMSPLGHRDPGVVGAVFTRPNVTASLIADGIHVHPAVLNIAMRMLGPTRFVAITDAIAAAGMPPGDYQVGPLAIHSDGTRATLSDGTLAGSVLTMDTAVRNLVELAGVSAAAAMTSATHAPALLLGESDRGRIEVGRRADLVILDPQLSVVSTVVAGQTVYGERLWG